MELRKVSWNGTSLVIAIPPEYARRAGLRRKSYCKIELNENLHLVISPLTETTKTRLSAKAEEA